MRRFKFLTSNKPTTEQLRRYHKRILGRYINRFNLNPGQPNYEAGGMIFSAVNHFINDGHLTTFDEVRRYYVIAYEHLSNGEEIVDDFDHNGFIWAVSWELNV